jgi:hypothetical protein
VERLGIKPGQAGLIKQNSLASLEKYEPLVSEIVGVNAINGPYYMQQFLLATEEASRLHAKCVYEYEQARDGAAAARAVATIDIAPDELKKREMRVNEEFCKQYALSDQDYLNAREVEAYWKAVSGYLENQVKKYEKAHDAAKKVYDKTQDPRGQGQSLPSGRDKNA